MTKQQWGAQGEVFAVRQHEDGDVFSPPEGPSFQRFSVCAASHCVGLALLSLVALCN